MQWNIAPSLLMCVALLAACASPPELQPKSAVVPAGVDFSGNWLLRSGRDPGTRARPGGSPDLERPIGEAAGRSTQRRSSRRSSGPSVHVFLETARSLKITQTDFGFFISLDRSVVEELKFGENRMVSVGPIEAQRVSGWMGNTYIVETLDEEGAILREEWSLDETGDVLRRDVTITHRGEQQYANQQYFERQ